MFKMYLIRIFIVVCICKTVNQLKPILAGRGFEGLSIISISHNCSSTQNNFFISDGHVDRHDRNFDGQNKILAVKASDASFHSKIA